LGNEDDIAFCSALAERWGDRVLRLRFTVEDLLRVRFAPEPTPLIELVLAVATLRRHDALFAGWRRRSLPSAVGPLLDLVPATAKGPLFLDPPTPCFDEGLDQLRSTPTSLVRKELQRAQARPLPWIRLLAEGDRETHQILAHAVSTGHEHLLAGCWDRIRAGFHAEQAWRARLLAEHGLLATLESLVPGAHWHGTTLEIDRPDDVEVTLNGRGLTLLPSVFWTGLPLVGWYPDENILVYPALTPLPLLEDPSPDTLAALLGRGRAAVLEQLVQPHTTTDLARHLGMAKSSVSEHAKTLRNSRLITTRRDGKAVWHSCTPLGLSLLRSA
jgi:DNA-binding transcriptional ArsR family regulator